MVTFKTFTFLCIAAKFVAGSYYTKSYGRGQTFTVDDNTIDHIDKIKKEIFQRNQKLIEKNNNQDQMIVTLQETTALQKNEISVLKSMLKFQENELLEIKETVKMQNTKLTGILNRLKFQETELNESRNHAIDQENELSVLRNQVKLQENELSELNLNVSLRCSADAFSDNFANSRMDKLYELHKKGKTQLPRALPGSVVAFYAVMSQNEKAPSPHHTLIFDTVKINENGGYNEFSGMFTAPVDGLYVFTVSIKMYCNAFGSYQIVKNAEVQGSMYVDVDKICDTDTVTLTVISELSVGNVIYVRTHSTRDIKGDIVSDDYGKSSFAGWLLSPSV